MGRSSSTQSVFLVERPDSKKFSYQRKLPVHLRPLMVGAVTIPWKARIHEVDAPETIKISLGTGDLKTARERRDQIHVQIEDLLARAQARLNAGNKAKLAKQIGALVADDIRQMAGQVRHEILAADDEAMVDRNWSTPLADLVLELASRGGKTISREDAVRAAQDAESRRRLGELTTRDIDSFDQALDLQEIPTTPDLIDRMEAIGRSRDPRGLSVDQDDLAALKRRPTNIIPIPGPVDAVLSDNGLAMHPGHPDRRRLALDLLRAEVGAYDTVVKRRSGDPTPTPERPASLVSTPLGETLSQMRDRWIELFAPGQKARDDNKLYLGAFIAIYGDLP